jgi:acetolactate synthase I/III small subunit
MKQFIDIVLEDKPGALMRVAGILSATGANIDTLIVEPDALQCGLSRMTIVADVEPHLRARVLQKIIRLVNVLSAADVTEARPDGSLQTQHPPLITSTAHAAT